MRPQHRRRHRLSTPTTTCRSTSTTAGRPGAASAPSCPSRWSTCSSRDITEGIAGTGVRAGVPQVRDRPPGHDARRRAGHARRGARRTGRPARRSPCTPTRGRKPGLEVQRVLSRGGRGPGRVVLGHSGDTTDVDHLSELADAGFLLGMDRFGIDLDTHVRGPGRTSWSSCAARGYADRMVLVPRRGLLHRLARPGAHAAVLPNWHYLHIERRRAARAARARGDRGADRPRCWSATRAATSRTSGRTDGASSRSTRRASAATPPGVKRYADLPDSVVAMLRASVERRPDAEAVVELDGPRLTYRELWDAAARVAGGLRAAGVGRGDRVAIRHGNGVDWVLGLLRHAAGRRRSPCRSTPGSPTPRSRTSSTTAARRSCSRPATRCRTGRRTPTRTSAATTSRRSSTRRARRASPRGR